MRLLLCAWAWVLAVGCVSLVAQEPPPRPEVPEDWHACEDVSQCAWVSGEGGWPDAVHVDARLAHRELVYERAAHTTYFTPTDCFETRERTRDFIDRSRQAVVCRSGRCAVALEPECVQ